MIEVFRCLQGSMRPEMSMSAHQYTHFNAELKMFHERAINKIRRNLLETQEKGNIYSPYHGWRLDIMCMMKTALES